MSTEEFCGGYKGTHFFEEGANQCRCGRAYKRPPRPKDDKTVAPGHTHTNANACPTSCPGHPRLSM